MAQESMSARQIILLIVMFIFGSSIIIGVNTDAAQDSWIAIILATLVSIPLALMYARILKLNPGESLFDIVEKLFGKVIGKIIILLFTWYALHLGAMVLSNFTKYIEISSLLNTPEIVIAAFMILITVYLGKSSITTLGKWSSVIFTAVMLFVLLTLFMSIGSLDINNLLPIMSHSPGVMFSTTSNILAFPLAETVLVLCLGNFFKKGDSPYKIFVSGLLIGGLILLIVFLRNIMILGTHILTNIYFPSYVAARVIEFGDFLTRIEGVITINFILAGLTKITVCLIAATKGMTKIFDVKNYKDLIMPAAIIILAMCGFLYSSVLEMFDFVKVYAIYVFPFQILIPIVVWITSEIRVRKMKVAV